jgi:hypothetical protein
MAETKSRRLPPHTAARRLLVREDDWRRDYSGTRAQIIEAGLAFDGQFPGDAACPGRTAFTFKRDTRSVTVRVRRPGVFWVRVGQSTQEKSVQREAAQVREEAMKAKQASAMARLAARPLTVHQIETASRIGISILARQLQNAEAIVREEGLAGIARRRIRLARDDREFQEFLNALIGQTE